MPSASSKKKTLQAAISECGCQREKLRSFAEEIVTGLSEIPASEGQNPLDIFISELVLSAADQRRMRERRQKQAEGIAAAQARGVRFGRPAMPLPDGFDQLHQEWRAGKMTLQQAADACGISKATFYGIAVRREQSCAG